MEHTAQQVKSQYHILVMFDPACPASPYAMTKPTKEEIDYWRGVLVKRGFKVLHESSFTEISIEERSWPDDASHENGKYQNTCIHCGNLFIGHKRRVECRACLGELKTV